MHIIFLYWPFFEKPVQKLKNGCELRSGIDSLQFVTRWRLTRQSIRPLRVMFWQIFCPQGDSNLQKSEKLTRWGLYAWEIELPRFETPERLNR